MLNGIKTAYLRWQAIRLEQEIQHDYALIAQRWSYIEARREEIEQIRRQLLAIGSEV